MGSPPPGREAFVINPSTVDKAPLLFHHLLDLADSMESHGLAAHAAAPLAMCEVVARLCLSPTSKAGGSAGDEKGVAGAGGAGGENGEGAASRSPALALVCLRRSRLLLKLGPT